MVLVKPNMLILVLLGGVNEGLLIKKGEIIRKVKQDDIVDVLKEEIIKMTRE